jgi:hypothetical protein
VSYWLLGFLIWIAPALLLGCTLLWVRFKTSPAARAPSDTPAIASVASDAGEVRPQSTVMVAAE